MSAEAFIAKWQGKDGSERANYQLFITELCELLGVPKPEAAQHDSAENDYTFERHVKMSQGDGTAADRYLDFTAVAPLCWRPRRCVQAHTPKALAKPCSKHAPRPRAMHAPCPPAKADHPS